MRPLCRCHGEPMVGNGIEKRRGVPKQNWACAERRRENAKRNFEALDGVAYNKRLLQMRRQSALYKRRLREERRGALQGEG